MDIQSVSQLVRVMEESSLSVLEVQHGELRVHMEKKAVQATSPFAATPQPQSVASVQAIERKEAVPVVAESESADQTPCKEGWKEIKSPMVGAFHATKVNGKPIGIGTELKKGATVCVVEAMKLMNDISMPEDGEIVWVAAKEGDMVEYGQLLFHYK